MLGCGTIRRLLLLVAGRIGFSSCQRSKEAQIHDFVPGTDCLYRTSTGQDRADQANGEIDEPCSRSEYDYRST
jgi:hypothetical protein